MNETVISWRFIAGFFIGGMIGVAFCKSSWPSLLLLVIAVIVGTIWHFYVQRYVRN